MFGENGRTKIILIDPSKEVYDEYPKSAIRAAERALAHKKKSKYKGGTLKMWAVARRVSAGKKLSLESLISIGSQTRLFKAKGTQYKDNRFAVHLDAWRRRNKLGQESS